MNEMDIDNIRNKIIITDDRDKDDLNKYSDIELAAVYSKNENNYSICQHLLNKLNRKDKIINILISETIKYINSTSSVDTLKLLIIYTTDICSSYFPWNKDPIILACRFADYEIIKILVENGIDINLSNPLLLVCENISRSHENETVKLLIEYGANVNVSDNTFWSSLACVCFKLNYELAKLFIEKGANVNFIRCNSKSNTILMKLCTLRYTKDLIKLLIDNGADVNIKNNKGETALSRQIMYCISYDDFEITKLLLSKKSNINNKDGGYNTPLMMCFYYNMESSLRYDLVNLLLNNKADIYIKNKKEKNILDIVKDKVIDKYFDNHGYYDFSVYSLIFNYKNLEKDHLCEYDVIFIYCNL